MTFLPRKRRRLRPAAIGGQAFTGRWRNWQTRTAQDRVAARPWGFKSPLAHRSRGPLPTPGPKSHSSPIDSPVSRRYTFRVMMRTEAMPVVADTNFFPYIHHNGNKGGIA